MGTHPQAARSVFRRRTSYVVNMALASLVTYWVMTVAIPLVFRRPTTEISSLWAVISTLFVYRDTRANSTAAGVSRLIGTFVSFVLCTLYLAMLPASSVAMAVLIVIGAAIVMLLGRPDDVTTTAITTAVIVIVAIIDPRQALLQPVLRLFDTLVGAVIGVAWKWLDELSYTRIAREPPR